jgi:O-antigen ligase
VTRRIAWLAVAVLAALPFQVFLQEPVGWLPSAIAAALVVMAALRPFAALLVLAALGPLATIIFILSRTGSTAIDYSGVLTLAFLTGWAGRRVVRPTPLAADPWLRRAATLLILLAIASAVVNAAVLLAEQHGTAPLVLLSEAAGGINELLRDNVIGVAVLFAAGLLLLLSAADVCAADPGRRDAVLRMLAVGAAGAAVLSLQRLVLAAVAQEHPWPAFLTYLATVRVNVHHGDLNAAGSYYAMMLFVAAGLAARSRLLGIGCGILIATGLWLAGSRTALLATFLTMAAAGMLALRERGWRRSVPVGIGLASLACVAFVLWMQYPRARNEGPPGWSLATRMELTKAGLSMAASQPIYGVGLGRFYVLSNQYAGQMLARQGKVRENAHNYFVQVLAELGVPGLVLFLSVLTLALRGRPRESTPTWASRGLLAGIVAFLLTCIGGHPLLVAAVAGPFWIATGLAATRAPASSETARAGRRPQFVVAATILIIVVTLPFRVFSSVTGGNLASASHGLSAWQRQPDGARFRWAGGRSTFYVPSSTRAVTIPLRHGRSASCRLEVQILLDGREANRVLLDPAGDWQAVRLIPFRQVPAAYSRIDLVVRVPQAASPVAVKATDTSGAIMIGRPLLNE